MSVSKDDILEAISNMTVVEVVDLIEAMEEKFGVTAAAPVAVAAAGGDAGGAAAAEQTEFDVVMSSFGDNKVKMFKEKLMIIQRNFLKNEFTQLEDLNQMIFKLKKQLKKLKLKMLLSNLKKLVLLLNLNRFSIYRCDLIATI